jgi:GlpG protein
MLAPVPRALPIQIVPKVPATGGLIGAAVLVAILELTGKDTSALALDPSVFASEPWRLWTSALPHVGVLHLAFNLYWTWVFGARVEVRYGSWRTAGFYALVAPVSAAAEYALFRGGVGLSGVGYGLFGLLWVVSKRDPSMADAMDKRTVQLFVALFFVCIGLTVTNMLPVANVAHGVGWATGALAGWARVAGGRRWLAIVATVLFSAACVAGAWFGRPYINLSGEPALEVARLADAALEEGDVPGALAAYERSLELGPDDARVRYNYGVALQRAQRQEDALSSFEEALALEEDETRRDAVLHTRAYLGSVALDEGRFADAVRHYERAVQLAPSDEEMQASLTLARAMRDRAPPPAP